MNSDNHHNKTPYLIVCPPPNVTGKLHIGHCVTFTYIDAIARYKTLTNHKVSMIGGTDHAANATTIMVRKNYPDVTPENFQEKALEWIGNAQKNIINQLKDLGVSMDWDKFCYTMDPLRSQGVIEAFNIIYKKGLIYKAKKMVNWDTHFGTAISDLEVNMVPQESVMYNVNYYLADGSDFITVATTRPETIFADWAIAINPDDERSHLIGQKVLIPIINKSIPIIPSHQVDKDFGTGFLKITPCHSIEDHNIWLENPSLNPEEPIDLMDNHGVFVHSILPQQFQGLTVKEARKIVIQQLALEGKKIKNNIPISDRSETVVEWKWTHQWFFDVPNFKQRALQLIDESVVKFWPQGLVNNYKNWINNLEPWCISRDLPLGHQIPIWYDGYNNQYGGHNQEEALMAAQDHWNKNNLEATPLTQDHHCLDTWFSSGLFHKSSLGWPSHQQGVGDLIVTGYDILFFWITRMILMSIALGDEQPFKNVLFHGLVRDKYGQKMSKTRGNTMDPHGIANEFGWDNLRLTLSLQSINNNDIKLAVESFQDTQKILIKIKNAHGYCSNYFKELVLDKPSTSNSIAQDMMDITENFIQQYMNLMEEFQCNKGVKLIIYEFFYQHFCDYFIEIHKVLRSSVVEMDLVLSWIFHQLLLLLHPYCPFMTEEIFQQYSQDKILNHQLSSNPNPTIIDSKKFYSTFNIIRIIRFFQQVFLSKNLEIHTINMDDDYYQLALKLTKTTKTDRFPSMIQYNDQWGFQWSLDNINIVPQVLQREIDKCNGKILQLQKLLDNPEFIKNADAPVVNDYKNQRENNQLMVDCLNKLLIKE